MLIGGDAGRAFSLQSRLRESLHQIVPDKKKKKKKKMAAWEPIFNVCFCMVRSDVTNTGNKRHVSSPVLQLELWVLGRGFASSPALETTPTTREPCARNASFLCTKEEIQAEGWERQIAAASCKTEDRVINIYARRTPRSAVFLFDSNGGISLILIAFRNQA